MTIEFNEQKILEANENKRCKVTDEEIVAAVKSGLFKSEAAIARYFNVTTGAINQRVRKLKERGVL